MGEPIPAAQSPRGQTWDASGDALAVTVPSAQHALVYLERRQMVKEISDLEAWAWAGRWQADACRESG